MSVASDGTQGNADSSWPSISADGRWLAFASDASNLVQGDTNGQPDIFVHDKQTGKTEMVSVSSDGIQSNGESYSPVISASGRWVAFWSYAGNLVAGDTDECGYGKDVYNCADIFVRDRQSGATERVRVGESRGLGRSDEISLSSDGRWMAFHSVANNLVTQDTNGKPDIFVYDRQTGKTELSSVASDGTQGNRESFAANMSLDGRWIAFASYARNLVFGDTNEQVDVFVHDRQTGKTERVSVASDGTQSNGRSSSPSISADGRWVVFSSSASNLVADDTTNCPPSFAGGKCPHIFVPDTQTGETRLISVSSAGVPGNDGSSTPSISADGRLVAFWSLANNLVLGDTNNCYGDRCTCPDIFVHDLATGRTERVSVADNGEQSNGASWVPSSISSDGRWIAFASEASNLVVGDTNGKQDIFVRPVPMAIPSPLPTIK